MIKSKKGLSRSIKKPLKDQTTEEKIKQAARTMFTHKGFAATRTRDIASEAGINLALLNYYFRSKKNLFDLIMYENIQHLIIAVKDILNSENTTLSYKVSAIVSNYIDLLKSQPGIPLFILNEIKTHPDQLMEKMGIKEILFESSFFKQVKAATRGRANPMHYFINIIALTIFPFVASPLLKKIGNLDQSKFDQMMEERKKLIPFWIETMLKKI